MTKKRHKSGKFDENHELDSSHDADVQLDESIAIDDDNQEIKELNDKLLRSRAELENFKKRHETEVEKALKFGVESLLVELVSVIDNLERAISSFSKDSNQEDREGIDLTLKSFESTLEKFNMRPINPLNENFNPEQHEAVGTVKQNDSEENSVIEVLQRGWQLHNRTVRPARVIVVKNEE